MQNKAYPGSWKDLSVISFRYKEWQSGYLGPKDDIYFEVMLESDFARSSGSSYAT